ncbi:hypothetical protein IAR55_004144 [Kwoniella newhampshirensis]|uniref:Ornithine decarboxylase antizyme n=1 Tax=Kwoniella newhampshirensis TaxID=1651941 RepID=A0AAW0YYJ1_9TREE
MNTTASIQINRHLRPAGALGSAGTGASSSSSLLFSPNHHHDIENPFYPPLAIARAGGNGGQIFVYSDADDASNSAYASFAGGGRRWDDNSVVVGQSSENMRDPLTSYLHQQFSQLSPSPTQSRSLTQTIFTPPSSFTQSVDIPHSHRHQIAASYTAQPMSLPLTPMSSSSLPLAATTTTTIPISIPRDGAGARRRNRSPPEPDGLIISLISSIFPHHVARIAPLSHTLEVITPPSNVLKGFILDHPSSGRTVYIHLSSPSPSSTAQQRPEILSPNFSQILRPHDPQLSIASPSNTGSTMSHYALDVREYLTALLDLASEALEANHLILVLDRDQDGLAELLHSLMYVGGQVVKPGALEGGWEWDPTKWVLVGMEL